MNDKVENLKEELLTDIDQLKLLIKKYQDAATVANDSDDPQGLKNALVRLSRVNAALGSKAAKAKYVARLADRVYRRKRDLLKLEFIASKNAIATSESMAYVDKSVDDLFEAYNECQFIADEADDLAYKTDTFLKMSQSSLSIMKNDIKGSV